MIFTAILLKNFTKLAIFALGFLSMLIDFGIHNQKMITQNHNDIQIIATVESISLKEKSIKYTLSHIENLTNNTLIEGKIMAYCKTCKAFDIKPNSVIKTTANIFPLPNKVYPSSYDIQNKYRFLGFSGFAFIDNIQFIQTAQNSTFSTFTTKIRNKLLHNLQNFTNQNTTTNPAINSTTLSLIEAIFLGETSRISTQTNEILRATGLTHIISISGFHISIIIFLIYNLTIRLLSLSKTIRHKINIRIPAIILSFTFSLTYLSIAGMPIAGIRSILMIFFTIITLLFAFTPKMLSSVIFSGFVLLIFYPHALFFASFQLSFLAILTLSIIIDNSTTKTNHRNILYKYCHGIIKSSLAITLITGPVVLYHFGTISLINPIANIIAIPLFTFIIMPLGTIFFTLTLTPLAHSTFNNFIGSSMFEAISSAVSGSNYISNFQYSFVALKEIPLESVLLLISGILLMFLIKTILKITGLILCVIGLGIFIYSKTPDIIANENALVFRNNNQYYILQEKPQEFVESVWRGKLGIKKDFLNGQEFCNSEGICITEKLTYIQNHANPESPTFLQSFTKCTDIIAFHKEINPSILPCKYKVILTKEALGEKSFVVLKYNEIWG